MIYLCSCFALTLPPSIIFSTILTSLPSSSSYNLCILYPSLLLTCSSPFFPPYFTPTLSIAFFQSLCPFIVLILPALHTLSYLLSPPHPSIKLSVQLATFPPPPLLFSPHHFLIPLLPFSSVVTSHWFHFSLSFLHPSISPHPALPSLLPIPFFHHLLNLPQLTLFFLSLPFLLSLLHSQRISLALNALT